MEVLKDLQLDISKANPEAVRLFLNYLAEETVIPELHLVFGNKILEFIILLNGTTLVIPTYEQIKDKLLDFILYSESVGDRNKFLELKKKYNIPLFEIERRVRSVEEWFSKSVIRKFTESGSEN